MLWAFVALARNDLVAMDLKAKAAEARPQPTKGRVTCRPRLW